jgi:hypothetical protein
MMADTLETFSEIRQIRMRIEGIAHTQEVLIRAHAEAIEKEIWEWMDRDSTLAQVYLLVDGRRSQTEIVATMQKAGVDGASHASVSRKMEILSKELHLVELSDHTKSGKTYKRTAIDRILRIGRKLEKRRPKGTAEER